MARSLAFALLAVWVTIACASAVPPAGDDDSELPPVADDSCARFGFQFTEGGCPEAECTLPLCSCPVEIRCIRGKNERCMSAVDCAVACAVEPDTFFSCAIDIAATVSMSGASSNRGRQAASARVVSAALAVARTRTVKSATASRVTVATALALRARKATCATGPRTAKASGVRLRREHSPAPASPKTCPRWSDPTG